MPDDDVENNFFVFLNLPWDFWKEQWDREICFKNMGPTAKPWDLAGLFQGFMYC